MKRDSLPMGLVYDMPAEQYHDDPGISNSVLSHLHRSPAHCWALALDPGRPRDEPTAAMAAGTLLHMLALEPHRVAAEVAVRPADLDSRTKAGKDWAAAQGERQIVTAEQMETAEAQRAALLAVPEIAAALASGRAEVSFFWIDPATGLRCKGRADWLHTLPDGRVIPLDLKTTGEVEPGEFGRSVWRWGYHRQAAHYTAGLTACGLEVAAFLFGAVTNARPFIALPCMLDDEALQAGATRRAELLALFAECQRKNEWPAYGAGVHVISLPAWAK